MPLRALGSLIKGRIALLVAATTSLGYWAATGNAAVDAILVAVVIGTALVSAGAGVLNNVLERDVDARMARTRRRALPQGVVTPRAAVWFGVLLTAAGAALLLWRGGALPALIGLLAAALYLFVYTPLKRYSWLNTPLGAIPGALPPLPSPPPTRPAAGWGAEPGSCLQSCFCGSIPTSTLSPGPSATSTAMPVCGWPGLWVPAATSWPLR